MANEREDRSESLDESQEREALRMVFDKTCERARTSFLRKGSLEPALLVLTRFGMVAVHAEFEDGFAREPVAREIRHNILGTVVETENGLVHDEPMALILAAEAWMVEYDPEEGEALSDLPPRLHPRRKEVLQVLVRSRNVSFCRTWPIQRYQDKAELGEASELNAEGIQSVWDIILTGERQA